MGYVVIYDACVLYPAPLRDFLLELAITDLFQAKWTDEIHDEWIRNLVAQRPELESKLERTRSLMNEAVPDALVTGYQPLVGMLNLPDPSDRHVFAAAIRCGAQAIITFNLKDFPSSELDPYDIEAMDPDTFVVHQFHLSQDRVLRAAKNHRARLKNPPKSLDEYLNTLASNDLVKTSSLLRPYAELI